MPHKLFLRPEGRAADDHTPLYQWGLYDVSGRKVKIGRHSDLDVVAQTLMQNGIEELEIIGLWPASESYSGFVNLPGNQARYLQQALPFAVEDQLAQDIETVHIAVGDKTKDGRYPVHVVDEQSFSAFFNELETFAEEQFQVRAVHLDVDCLPMGENDLVCWVDNAHFIARHARHPSMSSARDNLIPYLDSLFLGTGEETDEDKPFTLQLYCNSEEAEDLSLLEAQLAQYPGISLSCETVAMSDFELLCTSYFHSQRPPINLCQGAFKLSNQDRGWWRQWRYVAVIAGVGFLLQLGVFVGKGWHYQQEAQKIGDLAVAEYKKLVPGSSRVDVDRLPRIIKGKLNQQEQTGVSETDFLTLLGEAGYQFNRSSDKQQLAFNSITYSKQKGELILEMRAQNFEQLDRLKQAIVSAGFEAKISSAVQEDKYFRGRISVSGG